MSAKKHSRYSPSASHRWLHCPGSIPFYERLIADGEISEDAPSKIATIGTAAHFLGETCLHRILSDTPEGSAIPESYLGRYIAKASDGNQYISDKEGILIDEEMTSSVEKYVEYVTTHYLAGSRVTIGLEKKVSLAANPGVFGTVDCVIRYPNRLLIVDYKHGLVPVKAEYNSQLSIYALCQDLEDVEAVNLVIVQPRAINCAPISAWTTTKEELYNWCSTTLLPAIAAADKFPLKLLPGETQCKYCRGAPFCPALQNKALALAKNELAPPDILEIINSAPIERVIRLYETKDLFETAIAAARARMMHELQFGRPVPGYKLVEGCTKRRWIDGAEKVLLSKKIKKSDLYEKKLVSYTKLEKLYAGKYRALVEKLTEKPLGKPTLVPETDVRNTINLKDAEQEDSDEPT